MVKYIYRQAPGEDGFSGLPTTVALPAAGKSKKAEPKLLGFYGVALE
jgi:hypothetical protein